MEPNRIAVQSAQLKALQAQREAQLAALQQSMDQLRAQGETFQPTMERAAEASRLRHEMYRASLEQGRVFSAPTPRQVTINIYVEGNDGREE